MCSMFGPYIGGGSYISTLALLVRKLHLKSLVQGAILRPYLYDSIAEVAEPLVKGDSLVTRA